MIKLVAENTAAIDLICQQHQVKSLYLFGSATTAAFNANSDLDFVVEFQNTVPTIDYADNFFSLIDALESLFKRKVDLVSRRALSNPVMIDEIQQSQVSLYAA